MGSAGSAEALRAELAGLPHGAAPIGIGLVGWVAERDPVLLDVAVAAAPALLSVSFGDEWSWVAKAHEAGLMVATQVADVGAARRAVEAGVDVLVARGAEGGGHGHRASARCPCWPRCSTASTCRCSPQGHRLAASTGRGPGGRGRGCVGRHGIGHLHGGVDPACGPGSTAGRRVESNRHHTEIRHRRAVPLARNASRAGSARCGGEPTPVNAGQGSARCALSARQET